MDKLWMFYGSKICNVKSALNIVEVAIFQNTGRI